MKRSVITGDRQGVSRNGRRGNPHVIDRGLVSTAIECASEAATPPRSQDRAERRLAPPADGCLADLHRGSRVLPARRIDLCPDVLQRIEPDPLLTERDVAVLLAVSVKTLQLWRYQGNGPRYVKMGRCVRYRATAVAAFVAAHEVGTDQRKEA